MITTHVDAEKQTIELTISGSISREELGATLTKLEGPINEWDEIRVLKRVDSFSGIELMAFVDDIKFAYEHWGNYKKVKKVALVTDKEWITKLAELMQSVVPYEVECFESEDIEEARSWLA